MMKKYPRFIKKGFPRTSGRIDGLPLEGPVEVLRDRWGIPHIYAESPHDLFAAQGFVHAQDRLWQMESMRRFVSGRLSQAAGPRMLILDWASAAFGLPTMACAALKALSPDESSILQAYADGVNANLRVRGKDLPLEHRLMRISPAPWRAEDCLAFLALISFQMTAGQYFRKLAALVEGAHLSLQAWDDVFPSWVGETPAPDPFFEECAGLRFGRISPWALAFHGEKPGTAPGFMTGLMAPALSPAHSNNWVAANGPGGKPMLANDPHLGVGVPAPWYFSHLECPADARFPDGIHAAGASAAGCPGIIIGRNAHVAWGVTNVLLDSLDIMILRVDPHDPTRYRIRDEWRSLERTEERIPLPGGRERAVPVWRSVHGPAITEPEPGVEAVAVVKWYGTFPCEGITDMTFRGVHKALTAHSAKEVLEGGRHWSFVAMNLVAADDGGHIGWHPTGAAPRRQGYSGRLPADASGGADWAGFHPFEDFPHLFDPPEGFIATANQRIVSAADGTPFSHVWGPPFRVGRIRAVLSKIPSPTVEDFKRLQGDVHSMQADAIIPQLAAMSFHSPTAKEAAEALAVWNREVRADSAEAALWEMFLVELSTVLLEKAWGERLPLYFITRGGTSLEDVILSRTGSPLWDGLGGPQEAAEKALVRAVIALERRLGPRSRWSWGRLHRHVFHHPLGITPFLSRLLDPGSLPASGDCETVNVSWYMPAEGRFDVTSNPSMRMIAPLGDPDGMLVIAPLGQSGQAGHPHYEDMTPLWAAGEYVPLPMGRAAVEALAQERLTLIPGLRQQSPTSP